MTTWTEFCHFLTPPPFLCGQLLCTERGQKQTFFDPLSPHFVHVVIEWLLRWTVFRIVIYHHTLEIWTKMKNFLRVSHLYQYLKPTAFPTSNLNSWKNSDKHCFFFKKLALIDYQRMNCQKVVGDERSFSLDCQ